MWLFWSKLWRFLWKRFEALFCAFWLRKWRFPIQNRWTHCTTNSWSWCASCYFRQAPRKHCETMIIFGPFLLNYNRYLKLGIQNTTTIFLLKNRLERNAIFESIYIIIWRKLLHKTFLHNLFLKKCGQCFFNRIIDTFIFVYTNLLNEKIPFCMKSSLKFIRTTRV